MTYTVFNTKTRSALASGLSLNEAHAMCITAKGLIYLPEKA